MDSREGVVLGDGVHVVESPLDHIAEVRLNLLHDVLGQHAQQQPLLLLLLGVQL